MQSGIVVGAAIVDGGGGGGRRGGRRTVQTPNYRGGGWDRSSDVQMLFEDEPARPSRPLCVEILNKHGAYVLKIRYRICCTLIPY